MKNFPNLAIGSIVYGAAGKSAKVLSIDGESLTIDTPAGVRTISQAKVARVEPPPPANGEVIPGCHNLARTIKGEVLHIGDRITLADKYQVRAADVGTIEAISDRGIQVLWGNKIPLEPNLKQPPVLWRTFRADELELIESKYLQN